jgi:hypothetical protein
MRIQSIYFRTGVTVIMARFASALASRSPWTSGELSARRHCLKLTTLRSKLQRVVSFVHHTIGVEISNRLYITVHMQPLMGGTQYLEMNLGGCPRKPPLNSR